MNTPALLMILDGFGLREPADDNAISAAHAPYLEYLLSGKDFPVRAIHSSGLDVGLPDGQMGNSEVGHLNIGSGRVVMQELTKIDKAIATGALKDNLVLQNAIKHAKSTGGIFHLMGLLSDGGVHSDAAHLEALIYVLAKAGIRRIRIHAFLDGRDVAPDSGSKHVNNLQAFIQVMGAAMNVEIGIASIMGRYYAMDRDKRWDRVSRAWETLVEAKTFGQKIGDYIYDEGTGQLEAIRASYERGVFDEFVEPIAFYPEGINDGDSVLFFNFRPDRARELTQAFTQSKFAEFARERTPKVHFVCMTEYDETFNLPVLFEKERIDNTLADVLSDAGLRQLHIAETEKYAHVTFFLNGGAEEPKDGEERVLIPSPKVATYDLQPEMSAVEVSDALIAAIDEGRADVYIVNYANGDMVGHTGVFNAAVAAIETLDVCVKRVIEAVRAAGGVVLLTADHGNADKMSDADGKPFTAHTPADVPLIAMDFSGAKADKLWSFSDNDGKLADVAPTFLKLIDLEKNPPNSWTGKSLL
jgi:2,3-bisphosphoglycerate-independent phosphoglycerate mutase